MKQYLLIDIGGTFIKYSLADEQARKNLWWKGSDTADEYG